MTYLDPLRNPEEAFGSLDESRYKAELDLVDRYQTFVAELLRLSLAGIAIFGFLYRYMFGSINDPSTITCAKLLAAWGVIGFGACTAFALVFRFFATEGARFYIEALRFTPGNLDRANQSLDKRHRRIVICALSKLLAAVSLGVSGILFALSFYLLLTKS